MKHLTITSTFLLLSLLAFAQKDSFEFKSSDKTAEPFAFGDFTWLNGNDRRTNPALKSEYFTGNVMLDANYTYSFHNPIDHTVVGSTALARNNEVQVSSASIGGDFNYGNAHARIYTQFGTRSTIIPRNDPSALRGQYQLDDVYRYLSEAYAGYHFNVMHGLNVDMGMFMSYVGLFSYYQAENWSYQASFTSDNTPWYFNGIRCQLYPTEKIKLELWLINGWQSYAKYNELPGVGFSAMYCPNEKLKLISNNYYGTDAANMPDRYRVHSDNSISYRYTNKPQSKGISRAACSLTGDFGFESGHGVSAFGDAATTAQNFISGMFYNRIWFKQNHYAWNFGGGYMTNPGRYLVLSPTGNAGPGGSKPFDLNSGTQFSGWDFSTNFDWLPDQSTIIRLEYVHRESSVPYFAGKGGVTSPDGYITTSIPAGWEPDLVKYENRLILAFILRI